MVRFAAGFLHLLTAVMWFGTILYVHLLLKPAYASHGLPRGELIVGWGSIALIAVTGTILTFYRIPTKDVLLHTRLWRKGLHVGKHQAGFDLTDLLMLAPHEEDQILRLPVVGKIVERAAQERKPPHPGDHLRNRIPHLAASCGKAAAQRAPSRRPFLDRGVRNSGDGHLYCS